MNRRARTETPVHVIKLQQHNDAESSIKLYRKLHFLLSTSTGQIIHKLLSHSAVSRLKSASSYTWKCKWITSGRRTVMKLGAELAVCASARQELQVRSTLFEIRSKNLLIKFTSLLCNDHQGSFPHMQSQHSHPSTAKVKKAWCYTFTPS